MLAADLRLRSPDPIPTEWHEMAADYKEGDLVEAYFEKTDS